jgi:hypothetical protein
LFAVEARKIITRATWPPAARPHRDEACSLTHSMVEFIVNCSGTSYENSLQSSSYHDALIVLINDSPGYRSMHRLGRRRQHPMELVHVISGY